LSQETLDLAEFASRVGIMKPNSAKKDDLKAQAKLDKLLDDPNYALEEKIDGCHYKMFGHRFFSKDNVEKTNNFPHLRDFFESLKMSNIILDGELHVPGKTSQYATHITGPLPENAIKFQEQNGYIHFTIFDLLRTPKANWTIRNTYKERRRVLEYFYNTFIKGKEIEKYVHLVPMKIDGKREYLESLLNAGLEGGVLKKLDGQYMMGKKPMWNWMKVKQEDDADLFIMGFEPAKVDYKGTELETWPYWMDFGGVQKPVTKFHYHGWIGAMILGAYVNGEPMRICTASGFPESLREQMTKHPDNYIGKVVRMSYMERTSDGFPRHPGFKNFHEDKQAHECEWDFS
jgi:ATP-dependent DNA ligase